MTGVRCHRDVTFRQTSARDLELDLYLPEGEQRRPAVICFHGGGWENNHRGMFESHLRDLAEQGYIGVDATHRLSGEATFPGPIKDVKYAISWLKEHADEYGVDPDRVAVAGHSSGAHLAALAAVTPDHPVLDPARLDASSAVNAAVVMNGPYNLEQLGQTAPARLFISGFIRRLFGAEYLDRPNAYRLASCVTHVDGTEPPFLVLTSVDDEEVPLSESVQFRNRLRSAGTPVEFHAADDGGHLAFTGSGERYEEGVSRITAFLDRYL